MTSSPGNHNHPSRDMEVVDKLVAKYSTEDFVQRLYTVQNELPTGKLKDAKGYSLSKETLGRGAFGSVFKAMDKKEAVCAIKVVDLRPNARDIASGKTKAQKFEKMKQELFAVDLLMKEGHKFIVEFKEHFMIDDVLYIVMEYGNNATLFQYIGQHAPLSQTRGLRYFAQLVSAVQHLHKLGIAHRDIKLKNILMMRKDEEKMLVKLTDFGLSKFVDRRAGPLTLSGRCGTLPFLAPEVLRRDANGKSIPYDPFVVDIWALGVVLYLMLHKIYPYASRGSTKEAIARRCKEESTGLVQFPTRSNPSSPNLKELSEDCKTLVRGTLAPEPSKRITLKAIFENQCMIKFNEN